MPQLHILSYVEPWINKIFFLIKYLMIFLERIGEQPQDSHHTPTEQLDPQPASRPPAPLRLGGLPPGVSRNQARPTTTTNVVGNHNPC